MPHPLHRRRPPLSLATLALAAACGGDDAASPAGPSCAAGAYTLVSYNGRALPTPVVETTTGRIDLLAQTLTLAANATFTDVSELRQTLTPSNQVTTSTTRESGQYVVNGSIVILTYAPNNARATATCNSSSLTVSGGGAVYEFRRGG